jgi:hypothetical protein
LIIVCVHGIRRNPAEHAAGGGTQTMINRNGQRAAGETQAITGNRRSR